MPVSLAIFLSRNSSLIKSQNLLENPLLFPTQITNLLFVIKNRQPLKQNFMLNCKKTIIKKKRIVISLILFRCAKCFILPQKTKTSEKRVRSFQSQNSTAQSHKMQYLSQFFFLYRSSLTIQHKVLFQRLDSFDSKLAIHEIFLRNKRKYICYPEMA